MLLVKRTFLTISFFLAFISLLLAVSLKFQVSQGRFLVNTFSKGQIYPNLARALTEGVAAQTLKEGGIVTQSMLPNRLTEILLQEFLEKNLTNLTNFLNGKSKDWLIYIPSKKLPVGLIPPNFALKNDEITLEALLPSTSSQPNSQLANYRNLSQTGLVLTISLLVSFAFLLLHLYSMYKLEEPGKRFIYSGVSIILTSLITLLLIGVIYFFVANMARDLVLPGKEPAQILLGTLAPPLVTEIIKLWILICGVTLVAGIFLLFLTKTDS